MDRSCVVVSGFGVVVVVVVGRIRPETVSYGTGTGVVVAVVLWTYFTTLPPLTVVVVEVEAPNVVVFVVVVVVVLNSLNKCCCFFFVTSTRCLAGTRWWTCWTSDAGPPVAVCVGQGFNANGCNRGPSPKHGSTAAAVSATWGEGCPPPRTAIEALDGGAIAIAAITTTANATDG